MTTEEERQRIVEKLPSMINGPSDNFDRFIGAIRSDDLVSEFSLDFDTKYLPSFNSSIKHVDIGTPSSGTLRRVGLFEIKQRIQ